MVQRSLVTWKDCIQSSRGSETISVGQRCFCIAPEWERNELCYCVLPNVFDYLLSQDSSNGSVIVVVSPLIALMQGQVQAMTERWMEATWWLSALSLLWCKIQAMTEHRVRAVYLMTRWRLIHVQSCISLCTLAPSLFSLICSCWWDMLQSPIYVERLVAFVVDGAHCVKRLLYT